MIELITVTDLISPDKVSKHQAVLERAFPATFTSKLLLNYHWVM